MILIKPIQTTMFFLPDSIMIRMRMRMSMEKDNIDDNMMEYAALCK